MWLCTLAIETGKRILYLAILLWQLISSRITIVICTSQATAENSLADTWATQIGRFYGKEITKLDGDKEYGRLKKQLNRNAHAVEYKNGHDFRDGFRYKKGCEFYFRNEEEKNELMRKDGDERRLFLTGGLQMLFDGKSAQEHLVELECVSELQNLSLVKVLVKNNKPASASETTLCNLLCILCPFPFVLLADMCKLPIVSLGNYHY